MPMQARLHFWGGILIRLMRAVHKQAGGLEGWQFGRQSTAARTRDGRTLRGADVNSPHQGPPTLHGQGRRWLLLIRLISRRGRERAARLPRPGRCRPNRPRNQLMSPSPAGCSITYLGVLLPYPGTVAGLATQVRAVH